MAAACTSAGAGGSMARTRAEIGMEEITWLQRCSVCPPSDSTTTEVARPPRWRMEAMRVSMTTLEPWASTLSRQTSHIIPGPYLGYWNSSMREVMSFWLRFGRRAFMTAFHSDRFLIRCAAQSAWISVAGTPQTFSV